LEGIDSLNKKLHRANVYNKIKFDQIGVWKDIRNNADHGNFGKYNADDVRNMIVGVREFLSNFL